jgi:prepilin-type N-terminal cleavage/methylation domain-containing protein
MLAQTRKNRTTGAHRTAFTLVEILIVVIILGILAAIVLPKFSNASQSARQNTLKDDLRFLRQQVILAKAQHRDVPPGYPGGDAANSATAGDFITQMTAMTDNKFNIIGVGPNAFGPYLSQMPANPINGLDTIIIVANGSAIPAPDDSTGWIYKPSTQEIVPNLSGNDSESTAFSTY